MSEKKRYIWLDIIKILSCFLVIVNHSHGYLFQAADTNLATVTFDAVFFSICKIAVPLFVMTTGYLTLQKEVSYKKTFLRILRIFVPLVIVSTAFYWLYNGYKIDILDLFKKAIANPTHISLWYLYMLIGMYLVIPFIQKIVSNASVRDLSLFVLFFLILPTTIRFIAGFLDLNFNSFIFSSFFPESVCYLVAGVLLSKIPSKRSFLIVSIILYLASVIFVVLSIILAYKSNGQVTYSYDSWTSLPVIISSMTFFYIIRYAFENVKTDNTLSKIIQGLSATTFGVYIIHIFAINKLFYLPFMQKIIQLNAFIGILILQILIFVICSVFIFLIRKIPFVKIFL